MKPSETRELGGACAARYDLAPTLLPPPHPRCYDVVKQLAVAVTCATPPPPPTSDLNFIGIFPKEFQGGLRLTVTGGVAGTVVNISCGESFIDGVVGSTWGWDFAWTLRDGDQELEQHKYMECRFVSLDFSAAPAAFTLSGWQVSYPWVETDSAFASDNATLDAVYDLCRYTVHAAALDTYTDSNTRERTPYEADGVIAASGRLLVQRDVLFPRHSHSFVLSHPTWPAEWTMLSPYLAWQDFVATGRPDMSLAFDDLLYERTNIGFLEPATGVLKTDKMARHIVRHCARSARAPQASLFTYPIPTLHRSTGCPTRVKATRRLRAASSRRLITCP